MMNRGIPKDCTKEIQRDYDLGADWKFSSHSNSFERNGKLQTNVPPQVLFVEKCLKLLKEGGRMGIVLPESLLTSKSYSYVMNYMQQFGEIKAVIGMPEDFFKTSGKGGTHTKACLVVFHKTINKEAIHTRMFMAEAKWCGHDSRGRIIEQDDLPAILKNYQAFEANQDFEFSHLGYAISRKDIKDNIYSPRYYNPSVKDALKSIEDSHHVYKLGDLVDKGILEIKTGNEVGKLAYGTGAIPFVRTSDISNWEIKLDPKHGISEEIYKSYSVKQDVREADIFMVKDGTYLIGTCAMVSKYDTQIVYQSHLYKIRVRNTEFISPYILLAVLSSEPVQQQIKSKRFTQDIIDSLGSRIYELILPIPKNNEIKERIEASVKKAIDDRIEARELTRQACLDVVSGLIEI